MENEKELNNAFKTLIKLSDKEIEKENKKIGYEKL